MNFNNLIYSDAVETTLCTIVDGSIIQAPATALGNLIECTTENKMLQTVGKILQSVTTAFLSIWATLNLAEASFGEIIWEMDIVNYTGWGLAGLVLSMPLFFHLAENIFPENIEKIEDLQKSYSTAIKIVNIATSAIALGWFIHLGPQFITPILLNGASFVSSGYSLLHKNAQSSEGLKTS